MAISLYFGLPGAGKTTLLAKHALEAVKGKKYKNVYCNVGINIPGVTIIDNDCIGRYDIRNGLVLIDEGSLFADARHYKTFTKERMQALLLHRHYNLDYRFYNQGWDSLDLRIRQITDRCYYLYKGKIFGHWLTSYYRIPYGIIIPDPKKDQSGEKLGEIVQGYCKPNILLRIFSKKVFRPKYYKFFDSWECPPLPKLPERYKTVS